MGKATAIGGAGAWVLVVALGFMYAGWPDYIRPHPYAVGALAAAGGLMMLVPLIQWFHPIFKDKEATALQVDIPTTFLVLDLVIEAVIRTRTGDIGNPWKRGDLFIQTSAHLHAPASVEVEYTVELIRHGMTIQAVELKDVDRWRFAERPASSVDRIGPYVNANPLATSLSKMAKMDGWLHFQVELSESDINMSKLRLSAKSSHGIVYAERDPIGSTKGHLLFQRK